MPTIVVNPTLCSGNTGHIHITNQPAAYTYTLDAGTPQNTLHFYNQTAGNHTLQIATNNGCSIDTLLTVAEINNVVAQFTASPTSGDVPLTVNFTNQSANATNYNWYIENDTLNTPQANHTFDTSGVFTVTLVAYNTFPQCSDTAQVTIVAEYPFTIIAPSLYVSDENYTPYQIYTSRVKELHYELFTDQGKLVYTKVLLPTNGNLSLWNSNQLSIGIYLYRIWAMDDDGVEKVITGKVVVI
jgi:PKD repeat protein